ncbi:MAG: methyltransferase domain-containing protein [Verrucomicrobiota bacterium]|nr:methyltransferase domain-containing protein [Verrucomicrobiota bacterium]
MHKPHLLLAHEYWRNHLRPSDFAIDMTCGNGHDTLLLSDCLPLGLVYAIDIQEQAVKNTRMRLEGRSNIHLFHQSHETLPPLPKAPALIVYNLGYLPGGDKSITTQTETTLRSLQASLAALAPDGALSITCYPGHEEGAREETAVRAWVNSLSEKKFFHEWRPGSPTLFWIVAH